VSGRRKRGEIHYKLKGEGIACLVFQEVIKSGKCYDSACYVGPCHHGMACSWVVDGGYSLQIWRVAVNILNNQLLTADKGWSSSWGGGKFTTPHLRKTAHYEM
jgi:hypothetical protein